MPNFQRHLCFDLKLLILSCIRISAVIHDLELKQDDFTRVYYDSIFNENKNNITSLIREARTSEESKMLQESIPRYIPYEKIMVQLR